MSSAETFVVEDSKAEAYKNVLGLLECEINKAKERGDLATAETVEVLRAKVKAKFLGSTT